MTVSPKAKFLFGGALVLGTAGWLMVSSISRTSVYFLTPQELATKLAADSTFRQTGIKLGARVVPGTIQRAPGGKDVVFQVTDGVKAYAVVYHGLIPDTFSDSAEVVVDGMLDRQGTFRATTLLAKCGSRFESAPSKAHQDLMRKTS
jgi:cytochrome c-type biogenesis protein CcmE